MKNGDECGSSGSRQSSIQFSCNSELQETQVETVSEPTTCNYVIVLSTPLACESLDSTDQEISYSMNVYPSLNESLRADWDRVYSEFKSGIITEKVGRLSIIEI